MEYLQYFGDDGSVALEHDLCFKPCYKWNTFNTVGTAIIVGAAGCFKPCYKWNTFNTEVV